MKKLFWLFPILFLIDNALGVNGYQFTFFGIGIRILLFMLSMASLCLYCLVTAREQSITLLKRKPQCPHFWDLVKPIDYWVLGFILCDGFATIGWIGMVVKGKLPVRKIALVCCPLIIALLGQGMNLIAEGLDSGFESFGWLLMYLVCAMTLTGKEV